jgi:hypothetical protein
VSDVWKLRVQDLARHVKDLQARSYEGASSRTDKEKIFRTAFELTTPVAQRVLNTVNREYLGGRGTVSIRGPEADGVGGVIGVWTLAWAELSSAVDRYNGRPISPVELTAVFPAGWTHGHLALLTSQQPRQIMANWPFQVINSADAARQEPILWAMAEAELHERVLRAGHSSLGLFP